MDPLTSLLQGEFRFDHPSWLWFALFLPFLLLIARERQAAGHPRVAGFFGWLLRSLVIVSLVVALAGPRQEQRTPDRSVVVALDASASLNEARSAAAVAWVDTIEGARGKVPVRYVVRGDSIIVTVNPDQTRAALARTADPSAGTDLGELIDEAMAAVPPARRKDILLVSDGADTRHNVLESLRVAAARDLPVSVLPLPPSPARVSVHSLRANQGALVDQPVAIDLSVACDLAGPAEIVLSEAGTVLARQSFDLDPVLRPVQLKATFAIDGTHDLVVQIEPKTPSVLAAAIPLRVLVRPPPRALVVGDPGAAMAVRAALASVKPPLIIESAPTLPQPPYDALQLLMLLDPDLPAMGPVRGKALATWVRSGGRLLVAGGSRGLITDEPGAEDLAEILPVRFAKTKKDQRAPVAVVFVLDRSDSMAGGPKFEMAATALIEAVGSLPPQSQVGVLAFADFPTWVWPLQPFVAAGPILSALRQVTVAGGTSIFPALEATREPLLRSEALIKHIVLLSDGQSTTKFQRSGDVVTQLGLEKITVTTVTVTDASDRGEMELIAQAGGGRAYHAERFEDLPRLLLDELMTVHRTNKVEKEFQVLPVAGSRLLSRMGDAPGIPALHGYVEGEQRGGSELALATEDGHPLLVAGWYGRGRVVLFASDVGGPWTRSWTGWPQHPQLWEGVLETLTHPDPSEELGGDALIDEGRARVVLDVRDRLGAPRGQLLAEARWDGPAGAGITPLQIVGPGRYAAWLDLAPGGATLVRLSVTGAEPGAPKQRPPGGEVLLRLAPGGPAESEADQERPALLRRIQTETGGRENLDIAAFFAEPAAERIEWKERWPAPTALALGVLVLDVLIRRILTRWPTPGPR